MERKEKENTGVKTEGVTQHAQLSPQHRSTGSAGLEGITAPPLHSLAEKSLAVFNCDPSIICNVTGISPEDVLLSFHCCPL